MAFKKGTKAAPFVKKSHPDATPVKGGHKSAAAMSKKVMAGVGGKK